MGLHIDKPRQGAGNSNDGNTARRFFENYHCSSEITGVDEELIKRLYVILKTLASGHTNNPDKFGAYTRNTAQLYVENYRWYYMPSSVHKILIHGENIIKHFAILPIGQLAEDAQESRNKDYKKNRLEHSRKCSSAVPPRAEPVLPRAGATSNRTGAGAAPNRTGVASNRTSAALN
ncbi:hypothetical protein ACJJTC_006931 [Scirpophaga incertulas]